jgi:hypothetical protein
MAGEKRDRGNTITRQQENTMKNCKVFLMIALASTVAISACGGAPEEEPMDMHDGMPGMEGMGEMRMDPGMMERHADEAEEMAEAMRDHVEQMRERSPSEWHDAMGAHTMQLSRMLGLMDRQMREMDMGMGMSDQEMGQMMGMSGEEHRTMQEEMAALRADAERLQTAPPNEVAERMPAHLDRLERMVATMEEAADHMRTM